MTKKFHLTFLILIFILTPFITLRAESDIHSWKDIGILKTTENKLLEFAGPPTSFSLFPEYYFQMKKGLNSKNLIFEYEGYFYKNDNPILFKKTPLTITNEVISIKARFLFRSRYVKIYSYEFGMLPNQNISKNKYLNIFNKILGDPIRYNENQGIFTYYYKNNLTLTFWPDALAPFKIGLQFHPGNK